MELSRVNYFYIKNSKGASLKTYKILGINSRIFIVVSDLDGSSIKVSQKLGGTGFWLWDSQESLSVEETEKFLIENNLICPECKADLDKKGRCEARCYNKSEIYNI